MSYYYSYYIGYRSNGKFYPLGPFDAFCNFQPVICKSSSFASYLHRSFLQIKYDEYSDELKQLFTYTTYKGNELDNVKFLPFEDLPKGSYIKRGYFLTDDVFAYERDPYTEDIFYDYLTEFEYAELLKKEITFGKEESRTDEEGNLIPTRSPSQYTYYAYVDENTEEFEAFLIRNALDYLMYSSKIPKDVEYVVLETEG